MQVCLQDLSVIFSQDVISMKILLLGEYSGFFKNLKKGFELLGHSVFWISGGDGWKSISGADVNLDYGAMGALRKPILLWNYYRNLHSMKGYDVVLIINPSFFKPGATRFILDYISKYNGNIYLSACGDDYNYIKYGRGGNFKWWPFMNWSDAFTESYLSGKSDRKHLEVIMSRVTGVVPTCYDYSAAWMASDYSEKVSEVIGLPVAFDQEGVNLESQSDKVMLFHGLNREWFKGTEYIRPALEQLKSDYPQRFDYQIAGGLPYEEYLKLINHTDVVIDQCKVYSYGSMNAVLSMAKGKVVAGCVEKECAEAIGMNVSDIPIIPLRPNSEYIYSMLVDSLMSVDLLQKKRETLSFVLNNHEASVVAKKYLKLWES